MTIDIFYGMFHLKNLKFRNPRIFMFNPNARRQYEMDDYDERVECICTIVPIFDDFEQVYGNWFLSWIILIKWINMI